MTCDTLESAIGQNSFLLRFNPRDFVLAGRNPLLDPALAQSAPLLSGRQVSKKFGFARRYRGQ